jgi:hypothetical protein
MMSKSGIKATKNVAQTGQQNAQPAQLELSDEDKSKDDFFVQIAEVVEAMVARHGKDFAIGTLILSARFAAEGKPLTKRSSGGGET